MGRKERPIHQLIAIAYDDETIAGRAAEEVERCAEDLRLDPDAVAVLTCDRASRCHLTTTRRPGSTSQWSRFWGALLEVLVNGADPAGLDPRFSLRLKGELNPGTSVLLLTGTAAVGERMVETLSPFGGVAVSSPLGDDLPERWGVPGLRFAE